MAPKDLTPLSTTGRKYLDGTARARLQSPGIEHFPARKGGGAAGAVVTVVALVAALVATMWWWMQGR